MVDALSPFNLTDLADALLAAPAIILDATLTGMGSPIGAVGLLSTAGPIGAALTIRNLIATAIDPPAPPWLSWLAPAAKTPKTPAKTVTLNVTSSAAGSTPGTAKKPNAAAVTTGVVTDGHEVTPTVLGVSTTGTKGSPASTPVKTAEINAAPAKAGGVALKHPTGTRK